MQGYQLTFFTHQNRKHGELPIGEWLVEEACRLGISGSTLITAAEGFGRHRKIHSAHFFELADQPVEVLMAISSEEATRLLERLRQENINIFYIKTPIEFGMTGDI